MDQKLDFIRKQVLYWQLGLVASEMPEAGFSDASYVDFCQKFRSKPSSGHMFQ